MNTEQQQYKYVYVRGRVDSGENGWWLFNNTTEAAAVARFTSLVRRDNNVDKSTDVYIEVVVSSNTKFIVTDGCEF